MLSRAMRLCEASHAHLFTFDGEQVKPAAVCGAPNFGEWLWQQRQRDPPGSGSSVDRLRRGEPFVHVLDAREMPPYRSMVPRAGRSQRWPGLLRAPAVRRPSGSARRYGPAIHRAAVRAALARYPARVFQHALDDAVGAPAVGTALAKRGRSGSTLHKGRLRGSPLKCAISPRTGVLFIAGSVERRPAVQRQQLRIARGVST